MHPVHAIIWATHAQPPCTYNNCTTPCALHAYLHRIDQAVVVGEIYTTILDTLFPRALTRRAHYCTLSPPILYLKPSRSYPPRADRRELRDFPRQWIITSSYVSVKGKKFARQQGCESPECRFEDVCCCLSFVVGGGSRFRIARFHRTIVAHDEQPAILLAANVFA